MKFPLSNTITSLATLVIAATLAGPAAAHNQEEIEAAVEKALPSWVNNMKWKGDFRFRYDRQWFDEEGESDIPDRNRTRIRARFGFTYDINPNTQVGIQLATGSENPISTNQSLTDRFATKEIQLDKAYVKHTFFEDDLTIYAGKFSNPFTATTWILFDPDLRFEGASAQYHSDTGLFFNAGTFPLDEVKDEEGDPWLWAAQAGYTLEMEKALKATFAVGYYHFSDIASIDDNREGGNTEMEFAVLNPTIKVDINALPIWLGLQLDYLSNQDGDDDTEGYLVGAKFGHKKIKKLYDWQAFATYSVLEANAIYDEFPDSDFHSGGTNNEGFTLGYKLGLAKGWEHDLKYYITAENDGDEDEEDRIQVDLKYKF